MLNAFKKILQDYFLAGVLVLGPLAICYMVVKAVIEAADSALYTNHWMPVHIPGLGFLVSILLILFAGFLGRNILGRFIFGLASDGFSRIPILGSVYTSVKQILETLFVNQDKHFRRVVLVEFPQRAGWSLAFVTSEIIPDEIQKNFDQPMLSVFLPTTPIPTNGFYFFVARKDTKESSLSVEQAFKIIVSLGLVVPLPKKA